MATINGTSGYDTLDGTSGDDLINGLGGSDTINGGDGNDTLVGGTGYDWLNGGDGNDTFEYTPGDGLDTITDFSPGDALKLIDYDTALVTQLGSDVLVGVPGGDGIRLLNTDVATVQAGLQFVPTPITLNGTSRADTLTGGAGNDTLNGLGGNDRLNGGAGADLMKGGAGNDIYYVDDAGDKVTELSGQGTDTVHSTVSYTLGANVENGIVDGSSSIALIGNALANALTGSAGDDFLYGLAGTDKLNGGAGYDSLRGGLGADTLTGGLGADTFIFERGGGNDKVTDFVSGTDTIDLALIAGVTSADLKIGVSRSGTVISVDADHNGRADFTITLTGVSHINTGDFIFA